jgi:hypothetical protein
MVRFLIYVEDNIQIVDEVVADDPRMVLCSERGRADSLQ